MLHRELKGVSMSNNNFSVRELKDIYKEKSEDLDYIMAVIEDMKNYKHNFRVHFSDAEDDVEDIFVLEYILCKTQKLKIPLVVLSLMRHITDKGKRDCVNFRAMKSQKGVLEIRLYIESLCPTYISMAIDRFAIYNVIFRGKAEHLKFLLNSGKEKEFLWQVMILYQDEYIPNELSSYIFSLAHMHDPPENARRILLITDILYGAEGIEDDAKENVRIIWRSIPDVLVTFDEIYRLFLSLSTSWNQRSRLKDVKAALLNQCEKAPYPLHCPPRPRSLAHYCRCTIRRQLKDNLELPLGIYALDLPPKMVDYLKLEF